VRFAYPGYRPRGMGLETGVDLEALAETGRWLAALLGRPTGSKVGKALAGVILAVARIRPKAASGAGEQAPPRSAAVSARQSSPPPLSLRERGTPGALRLPGLRELQRRGAL